MQQALISANLHFFQSADAYSSLTLSRPPEKQRMDRWAADGTQCRSREPRVAAAVNAVYTSDVTL